MRNDGDLALSSINPGCSKALKNRIGAGNEHGELINKKINLLCCLCGLSSNELGTPCIMHA